jgi:hypothetical protein
MNINKIIDIIHTLKEEGEGGGPTNNVGDGNIAGTIEAGDDPPFFMGRFKPRKKKKYISGGKGSRSKWLKYLKTK